MQQTASIATATSNDFKKNSYSNESIYVHLLLYLALNTTKTSTKMLLAACASCIIFNLVWLVSWLVCCFRTHRSHLQQQTYTHSLPSACENAVFVRSLALVHLFVSWLVSQIVRFAFFIIISCCQWLLGFCARRIKPKSSDRRMRAHLPRITHSIMKLRDNNQYSSRGHKGWERRERERGRGGRESNQ